MHKEVERLAYLYHFYDPVVDDFVNTGHSTLLGKNQREYLHVSSSKKSGANAKVTVLYYYKEQNSKSFVQRLDSARTMQRMRTQLSYWPTVSSI